MAESALPSRSGYAQSPDCVQTNGVHVDRPSLIGVHGCWDALFIGSCAAPKPTSGLPQTLELYS